MIKADNMTIGFFADPAGHSKSPAMHNAAFKALNLDYEYKAFTVSKDKLGEAMEDVRTLSMVGVNISMPNKEKVMDFLDEIDPVAEKLSAVNTVVNKEGHLKGYNTDALGAAKALKEMVKIDGSDAVLLGLGGAGRAVLQGLIMEGINRVSIFVRDESKANKELSRMGAAKGEGCLIEIFNLGDKDLMKERIGGSAILINSTNVGMGELEGKSLIPDETYLHPELSVMDVIYSPLETELIKQAKRAGVRAYKNGLDMLLYQGTEAFTLFTGKEAPVEVMREAIL